MPKLKAIIFDWDGTIVESHLNFASMRKDIGISENENILIAIEQQSDPTKKTQMMQIVHEHEMKGAQNSHLVDGAREFIEYVHKLNIPMAILTRNSRDALVLMMNKFDLSFELTLAREDVTKHKPDPEGLFKICNDLSVTPSEAIYVGDYLYDIQAALNAQMKSVYFAGLHEQINLEFQELAHVTISSFDDFKHNLQSVLEEMDLFI